MSLVEEDVVADAYARGVTKLAESTDGEHHLSGPFEEAIGALRTAAEQGHRAAQSLYGRTLFSALFMVEAPTEEQREDYLAIFTFLRIAALRGDSEAKDFLPGLTDEAPATGEPPLDQIPSEWLTEAFAQADAWMACHGDAAGDRGAD